MDKTKELIASARGIKELVTGSLVHLRWLQEHGRGGDDDIAALERFVAAVEALPKRKRGKQRSRDNYGTLYYFGDLLKRLPEYFKDIRALKKHDLDGYSLYSQLGGTVFNNGTQYEIFNLGDAWKRGERPGFGLAQMSTSEYDEKDKVMPRLLYFKKLSRSSYLAPTNGELYEMSCLCCGEGKEEYFISFRLSVDGDGGVTLLKEMDVNYHVITSKQGKGKFSVPRRVWQYPEEIKIWAEEQRCSPDEMAVRLFAFVANSVFYAEGGLRVFVGNGAEVACFNIEMTRTAYFFKDRIKIKTEGGHSRKVFHIVRPHKRVMKDGTVRHIKAHFKGESKFTWNSYNVSVGLTGKHFASLNDVALAALDADSYDEDEPHMDANETGSAIAKAIGAGGLSNG